MDGLMTALTGAFSGGAASMKKDRLEGDQQIKDAYGEVDKVKEQGIAANLAELEVLRNFEGTQLLDMEKNFNTALSKFGPDQQEELNTLAESMPEIFQGSDRNAVLQNVENYLLSKGAPDIRPSGEIYVPTEGGTSQRLLSPEEGGDLYSQYLERNKGMTGGEMFRSQYNEMTSNVGQMLQQTIGKNTADVFVGDYLKPGSKGEERFQTRAYSDEREAQEGAQTASEFQADLSGILTQKLYTQPDAVTRSEMIRATNWTPFQDFSTVKNAYLEQYKGNELMASTAALGYMIRSGDAMEVMGMDRQAKVRSGEIPSGTIAHVLTTDPAGDIAVKKYNEATRNPDTANIIRQFDQIQNNSFKGEEEGKAFVTEQYNNLVNQIYNEARLEVKRTNYYTVAGNFINAYTAEEYPPHLSYMHSVTDESQQPTGETVPALFYPIASDGFIKLLDANNPDPENPLDIFPVQYMIPEAAGGNPDRTKNIYYNPNMGYDSKTDRNPRLDMVFAEMKANDPFGMGLQITTRGASQLEEFEGASVEAPDLGESIPDEITEENFESFAPPENYRFRKSIAGEYRPTAEYLEWASKNLDVWKKFLDNLTAPIAENYPAPKQGQYVNPEFSRAMGVYKRKLRYQQQLEELERLVNLEPYSG